MDYLLSNPAIKKTEFTSSVSFVNITNSIHFKSNITEFTSPKIKLY